MFQFTSLKESGFIAVILVRQLFDWSEQLRWQNPTDWDSHRVLSGKKLKEFFNIFSGNVPGNERGIGVFKWLVKFELGGKLNETVSGNLTELSIYFEGPGSGINYYLDDVSAQ